MSRFQCKCGEFLSNSNRPEFVWRIFTDQEYSAAVDHTEEGGSLLDKDFYKM